jgi:CubicO group peptidase (beta-lactamase class C family)
MDVLVAGGKHARRALAGLDRAVASGDYGKITSVVVAHDNDIVRESYFGMTRASTLHDTRSLTTTVTGYLVGIAIDRGLLKSVETEISSLLPIGGDQVLNPDPRKDAITVEDLLTMSSPLDGDDSDMYSRGHQERMYLTPDWSKFALDLPVRDYQPWEPLPEESPYGRRFSYCAAGAVLLGRVLEAAIGEPVEAFAAARLFEPIGIGRAEWARTAEGTAMTAGGLRLSSRDLLALGQLALDGGMHAGRQVVSRTWIRASTSPSVEVDDETEYGYLWWLKTMRVDGRDWRCHYMAGFGGNRVAVFPEDRLVVVVTSENFAEPDAHERTERLINHHVLAEL